MIKLSALAKKIDGVIEGNSNLMIHGVGDLRNSPKEFLSFLSDNRYYEDFKNSPSWAVIVNKDFIDSSLNKTIIKVDNPVFAYIKTLEIFNKPKQIKAEIHETAIISS